MWITGGVVVAALIIGVRYYVVWQRGDNIRIPGVGVVRRFPCADYDVPSSGYPTTQAFAVIDGAAVAAQSNTKRAVRTLVDAVFDRELPAIRCGNPLRRRVTEGEWRFRTGTMQPITEQMLADTANAVSKNAEAPLWARTSTEELHFLRVVLKKALPRFVGIVDGDLRLSDKMSPVEAVFIVMTLGRGMVLSPDEFRDGPDVYVARARGRQSNPSHPGAVLRGEFVVRATVDLATGEKFDEQRALPAVLAQRFLDQLGFPK
jgi:hypothetical protein